MILYRSFRQALDEIPIDEQLHCFKSIIDYALDDVEPKLTGISKMVFCLVKPQIDANNRKYENGCKGGQFGKLGGRPKTPKKPHNNPNKTPNVNDNANVKGNVSENAPTKAELDAYCREIGKIINTKKFIDFYQSKGWLVGNVPMQDWRACVRNWQDNTAPQTMSHGERLGFTKGE